VSGQAVRDLASIIPLTGKEQGEVRIRIEARFVRRCTLANFGGAPTDVKLSDRDRRSEAYPAIRVKRYRSRIGSIAKVRTRDALSAVVNGIQFDLVEASPTVSTQDGTIKILDCHTVQIACGETTGLR
jgi:hypothetical protein